MSFVTYLFASGAKDQKKCYDVVTSNKAMNDTNVASHRDRLSVERTSFVVAFSEVCTSYNVWQKEQHDWLHHLHRLRLPVTSSAFWTTWSMIRPILAAIQCPASVTIEVGAVLRRRSEMITWIPYWAGVAWTTVYVPATSVGVVPSVRVACATVRVNWSNRAQDTVYAPVGAVACLPYW